MPRKKNDRRISLDFDEARRVTRYQTGGEVARLIDKSRNLNEFFRTQEHRRPLRSLESLIICLRHAARLPNRFRPSFLRQ